MKTLVLLTLLSQNVDLVYRPTNTNFTNIKTNTYGIITNGWRLVTRKEESITWDIDSGITNVNFNLATDWQNKKAFRIYSRTVTNITTEIIIESELTTNVIQRISK